MVISFLFVLNWNQLATKAYIFKKRKRIHVCKVKKWSKWRWKRTWASIPKKGKKMASAAPAYWCGWLVIAVKIGHCRENKRWTFFVHLTLNTILFCNIFINMYKVVKCSKTYYGWLLFGFWAGSEAVNKWSPKDVSGCWPVYFPSWSRCPWMDAIIIYLGHTCNLEMLQTLQNLTWQISQIYGSPKEVTRMVSRSFLFTVS
jgi:hypothetical protein